MLRSKILPIAVVIVALCAVGLIASGCGDDKSSKKSSKAKSSKGSGSKADRKPEKEVEKKPEVDRSLPTMQTVLTTDSAPDNTFTVRTPKGWTSAAVSTGDFEAHRELVTTASPDGGTMLFISDPSFPNYWDPATASAVTRMQAKYLDFVELKAYEPATSYYASYAKRKFGKLDDFKLTSSEVNQKQTQKLYDGAAAAGNQLTRAEVADVKFTYSDNGTDMEGLITGYTADGGNFWVLDFAGISTDRHADDYRPMLDAMFESRKTRPEWLARRQQSNDQAMAEIQRKGEAARQNSAAQLQMIQDNAIRQQERQTSQVDSFYARMDANDNKNRAFSDYLNDQKMVVTPSGSSAKVDLSYDRYFINKSDGSYVAGGTTFDQSSLRDMGLDPNNYEQAEVKW